jgi:HAD superfamily hydrolase (TIGR01549 family)
MQLTLPKAVLFDMDGTLTEERIDFDAIRIALNLAPNQAILEAVARMHPSQQAHAQQIIHDHETHAAACSVLNEGCRELLSWLDTHSIGRALVTRNTRQSVNMVLQRHQLHFDIVLTREDGMFKPDPQPLLYACQQLGVPATDAWMVGDWKYDIEAANRAGVYAVWLSYGRTRPFKAVPDHTVMHLKNVLHLLQNCATVLAI